MNSALLDYLVSHCKLHHHFITLKRFLLLEDGEFGQALSDRLCHQLSFGRDWRPLCSPSFLNPLLVSCLEASLQGHSVSPAKLSFFVKYQPNTMHANGKCLQAIEKCNHLIIFSPAVKALDFLELKYEVSFSP